MVPGGESSLYHRNHSKSFGPKWKVKGLCTTCPGENWTGEITITIYLIEISLIEGEIKINRPENVTIFCLFRHLALDLVRSKSNW